jgi:hypothetical protein
MEFVLINSLMYILLTSVRIKQTPSQYIRRYGDDDELVDFIDSYQPNVSSHTNSNDNQNLSDITFIDIETVKHHMAKLLSVTDNTNMNESLLYPLNLVDGTKLWVCMELIENRLNVSGVAFQRSVQDEHMNREELDIVLQFVYTDNIAVSNNADLQVLIRVYSWALKSLHCDRMITLLHNSLVSQINASNVISVLNTCIALNNSREKYQKLISHCVWLIRSYVSQGKELEVKDIFNDAHLFMKVFQSEQCQATEEQLPDSKFASDVLSLYNSSMGSLECQVDDVTCIKIVPVILAVSCEYYWNWLNGLWQQSDKIKLFEVGLDDKQIELADKSELKNRGEVMAKLIKHWHCGSISIGTSEVMDVIDIFKFLGLDSATDNPVYENCLNQVGANITIETILPLSSRFITDEDLQQEELSKLHTVLIQFAVDNMNEIYEKFSNEEITNYWSKQFMQRVVRKQLSPPGTKRKLQASVQDQPKTKRNKNTPDAEH